MEENHQNKTKSQSNPEAFESKYMDGQSYRTDCGLCCVCHTLPIHSRTYYGHIFCVPCFHKYIWSPTKPECSGDLKNSNGEPSLVHKSAQ